MLSVVGDDTVVFEASDESSATYSDFGASCTDTCTALTATSSIGYGQGTGPDNSDISGWIDIAIAAYEYEDYLTNGNGDVSFVDSQQFYCGASYDDLEENAALVESEQPSDGQKQDTMATNLEGLVDVCGVYTLTYTCTDNHGLTTTASQYAATMDTTDPVIYYDEDSTATLFFGRLMHEHPKHMAAAAALAGAGVALLVTRRRRAGYEPIPV